MTRRTLVVGACAVLAAVPAAFGAAKGLVGTVGPGFTITLADASGSAVSRVEPGVYEIVVRDLSDDHNFHLSGPGVDRSTAVEGTGTVTWTVTLQAGRYTLLCDPHPAQMQRQLTVGTAAVTPPAAAVPRLLATVGPGRTISLRSASGARLRSLKPGKYAIVVRDRTAAHNFHLVGPGVNRRTGVAQKATTTWRVTLRAGTLRFFSDRAARTLKGSIPVR